MKQTIRRVLDFIFLPPPPGYVDPPQIEWPQDEPVPIVYGRMLRQFAENQEPLGEEFERVWDDHALDLYEN